MADGFRLVMFSVPSKLRKELQTDTDEHLGDIDICGGGDWRESVPIGDRAAFFAKSKGNEF